MGKSGTRKKMDENIGPAQSVCEIEKERRKMAKYMPLKESSLINLVDKVNAF